MNHVKYVIAAASAIGVALACGCGGPVVEAGEEATVDVAMSDAPLSTNCSGDAIGDPPQFEWTYVSSGDYYIGELEVSEATFNIDGETLTTRAYRQPGKPHSIPGPTITMEPGNKYVLRFQNRLPYEPLNPDHNIFKDPNASNLHTHGLHISGESPGDDVTRTFEGGTAGDFVYDIPADHMGGTFWYHAHHHGSTFLQVSGGTFGQLIIKDSNDGLPANVAAMEERQIVLGYLDPGVAGTGGDTLIQGTLSPSWTINGATFGSLCMPSNEWQHWRVLLADRDAKEKTITFGSGCEVGLLARDGVWRTSAPSMLADRSISITGASRADFAVRCTSDSTLSVAGNTVANIVVGAEGNTSVHPFAPDGVSMWSAIRPEYLRDLRNETNVNTENVRMGARTVNGSRFDMTTPTFELPADSIQEWSLSGSAQHPFHLHIYHVQAQNCSGDYEDGEYYDVMASNCAVRFDMNTATSSPYEGRTIMHCHILEHEDQGAMGWMKVLGGASAPTFPNDTPDPPFSEYYTLDGGASCGDGTCDAGEDECSCAGDCGSPPGSETACSDGLDDDCDGDIDCDDADCSGDPNCSAPPSSCDADGLCESGEDCNNCPADCDGVSTGRPTNRYCCGDGIAQTAEGNGSICNGNY